MRNDHRGPTARRFRTAGLTALTSAAILVLAGFFFAGPAQADQSVDPGTNVAVVSNACGEVTFTGANSDSTISITIGGEFGETFDVGYEESVTIETKVSPLTYVAATQWGNGGNWIEEGGIEVEPCQVEEKTPEVKKPTVAPDAGR